MKLRVYERVIIHMLEETKASRTIGYVAQETNMSWSAAKRNLHQLDKKGLVTVDKKGLWKRTDKKVMWSEE